MAKLVGLDCGLNKLARRMKYTQCQGRAGGRPSGLWNRRRRETTVTPSTPRGSCPLGEVARRLVYTEWELKRFLMSAVLEFAVVIGVAVVVNDVPRV
jgi:hypothetical protein